MKRNESIVAKDKSDKMLGEAESIFDKVKAQETLNLLAEFDNSIRKLDDIVNSAGDPESLNGRGEELRKELNHILDTAKLEEEHLPDKLRAYFDHDAAKFREMCKSFLTMFHQQSKKKPPKFDFLLEHWPVVKNNWEAYRLVVQDVINRGATEDEVVLPDKDKNKDLDQLLDGLKWLVSGFENKSGSYSFTGRAYLEKAVEFEIVGITEDELRKMKVGVPHGMIFNLIQNCVTNAGRPDITGGTPTNMRLKIEKKGDNLEFYFSDSGSGIPPEIKEEIFESGFTTKSDGRGGKGLAYADTRLQKVGGSIEVLSPDKEDGWSTTFKISVPII
jgi:signal transduction histidine kinase